MVTPEFLPEGNILCKGKGVSSFPTISRYHSVTRE